MAKIIFRTSTPDIHIINPNKDLDEASAFGKIGSYMKAIGKMGASQAKEGS